MADTARTLFDGKSDTIPSKPEMIRDLPQRSRRKAGDVQGQCAGAGSRTGPLREREPLIGSIPESSINCAQVVVKRQEFSLTDSGISSRLIRTFQSALNSVSPIAHI